MLVLHNGNLGNFHKRTRDGMMASTCKRGLRHYISSFGYPRATIVDVDIQFHASHVYIILKVLHGTGSTMEL